MTLAEQFISIKKYGYILDNKTDANGNEHSGTDGRFVSKGEEENKNNKTKGVAAKLRDEFNKNTDKYLNTDFTNKTTGKKAKFTGKSQKELRSRTDHTKENGFTIQEHFEVANKIKELFETATLEKEHEDTKHGDKNLRIERYLSQPVTLKSGKKVRACITVKHTIDADGRLVYSIEAMDIKKALEQTRAKGQHQNGTSPSTNTLTHDCVEVKSLSAIFRQLKGA